MISPMSDLASQEATSGVAQDCYLSVTRVKEDSYFD